MTINERASSAIFQIVERAELLRKLGPDLLAIIDTDARNSSTRDGYPGGGAQEGPRGNSELTPTEAGASARMGKRMPDEYHREVIRALDSLEVALAALKVITTTPERIKNLQTQPEELAKGNDSWCWLARHLGLPYDTDWDTHRTTDFQGYLAAPWPEPRPVCRWVYDYTRGRRVLPSEDDMLNYLRRRGTTVRVDPKGGRAA